MKITPTRSITETLTLAQCGEIPVLVLAHAKCHATISLQGGQLLSWRPTSQQADIFWVSEIESFKLGNPIRGGVPVCFPWFGGVKSPSHGTARIRLWQLSNYQIDEQNSHIELSLFDEQQVIEAKIHFEFSEQCKIHFTNYAHPNAQLALHSYFNLSHINQLTLQGLPETCFNSLTQQRESVPSPRVVQENVDCIYTAPNSKTTLADNGFQRKVVLEHTNNSEIVVWNPWHKATSSMSETGYETMVCVETARVYTPLALKESVTVQISLE